jgi:hypothetical protein
VSWVAAASSSGVESSTRRRPVNNPAARAVAFTSSNSRRGRSLPRSRLRIPTNTVGWNEPDPTASPAAAFHRRSNANRSHASRSDSPSKACNNITVATTRAATVGRPNREQVNRSAE